MGRLRRKKGLLERLLEKDNYLVKNPIEYKGKWKEIFDKDKLYIELGTGKGQFITTLAEKNEDVGYIGVEKIADVLFQAVKKAEVKVLNNIKFLLFNVNEIENIFEENEVDRIYINFCDPWPKKRHTKRRLTYRDFLNKYKKILKPNGEIHFKTDNERLFEFSLNEMSEFGLELRDISLNLYRDGDLDTVKTEYEEKFISQGKPIYFVRAIIK
ncbi:tRNA (guanine-N7)-methyltransferase [Caloranaerobacter sp. TR13]|uniref:tRNA (guanosine(46)-N7)-methyltransferase TrmB n=1 Tax=Caloranaerobacter sp. TR13 TaxID=1302151 RepID=UPI0006D479C5|nr:tRNA (guanosine(46)-N7)-methyltransferase TrmB [Caloranaerobacter sp. TR13]KPU27116.1 tRNA (guanine-N7)-methyltransferase [Caloranaerobacter sp. TR13]